MVDRDAVPSLFAFLLLLTNRISAARMAMATTPPATGIAILAPRDRPSWAGAAVTSRYFCAKTWSVISVSPDTVGVVAGTSLVAKSE